jgi:hypothetical protein
MQNIFLNAVILYNMPFVLECRRWCRRWGFWGELGVANTVGWAGFASNFFLLQVKLSKNSFHLFACFSGNFASSFSLNLRLIFRFASKQKNPINVFASFRFPNFSFCFVSLSYFSFHFVSLCFASVFPSFRFKIFLFAHFTSNFIQGQALKH